ncbi:MAG: hypothetical protein OES27_05715 [Nitrosopumilus sp.]|nr:hypothetical protein [Nitrosopumilus sp.]
MTGVGIPAGVMFELKSTILESRLSTEYLPPWTIGLCVVMAYLVLIFTVSNRNK